MKRQSLEVTPDPVIGVLGKSVDITWAITKIDQDDVVSVQDCISEQELQKTTCYIKELLN